MNTSLSKPSTETPKVRSKKISLTQREPEGVENTPEGTSKNSMALLSQLKALPKKTSSSTRNVIQDYRKSRVKYSSINLNDLVGDQNLTNFSILKQSMSPNSKQKTPANNRRGNLSINVESSEQTADSSRLKKLISPKSFIASDSSKTDIRAKRVLNMIQSETKTHSLSLTSPTKVLTHHRDASKDSVKEYKGGKNTSIDLRAFVSPRRPIKFEEPHTVKEKKVPVQQQQHHQPPPQQQLQPSYPWSPQYILENYETALSPLEKTEIFKYKEIYYFGENATKIPATNEQTFEDERNDYKAIRYDHIAYRYEILDILGKGSFGQVLKVFDHQTNQEKALKIIRNQPKFHYQAKIEIKILKYMAEKHCEDYNIIKMEDSFIFRGHQCLIFEMLSMNLYEYIKLNKFKGLSLSLIRRIAIQVLYSLKFTRKHKIIHCDLKPENILLRYPNKSGIRVIDFGSSCFESEKLYTYIQSRFYRSPEVILGLSYDTQIDMWSFGCLLAELFMGYPIFPGESEGDQLLAMMEILGEPDLDFIQRGSKKYNFFDEDYTPKMFPNSKGKVRIPGSLEINSVLRCRDPNFVDLVQNCLVFDPKLRYTPDEALCHPWILEGLPENLQAQHLKLVRNETERKEISATKTRPVPETTMKNTQERSSSTHKGEIGVGTKEEFAATKQDSKRKPPLSNNTEPVINVVINVDSQRTENIKPKIELQANSQPVNEKDSESSTDRANTLPASKSSGNINFINNIYYISNETFATPQTKLNSKGLTGSISPKKQFVHHSPQRSQDKLDTKLQNLMTHKRQKSNGAEQKIQAYTPKSLSSSAIRWRPNSNTRRENIKKNGFFSDVKKDL